MNFPNAVENYFLRCVDFKTRSSRSEYWWAFLFVILLNVFQGIFVKFIAVAFSFSVIWVIADFSINVFIIIASIALGARRLHDINKSGWWNLLQLIIIGVIPLLIWACIKGDEEENRFGANPLKLNV